MLKNNNIDSKMLFVYLLFKGYGDHRELHVLTHSCPTRRSSDLATTAPAGEVRVVFLGDSITAGYGLEVDQAFPALVGQALDRERSEEHTSELQSLMRISYAVFCLKKKKTNSHTL